MAIDVTCKVKVHNEEPKSPIKVQSCEQSGRSGSFITLVIGSEELIISSDDLLVAIENCTRTNSR